MKRHLTCLLALPWLFACQSGLPHGPRSQAELQAESLQGALFLAQDVAEIEALRPQLTPPFKLGITPPVLFGDEVRYNPWGWSGQAPGIRLGTWTPEEVMLLERWAEEARAAGLVSEVEFLPAILIGNETEGDARGLLSRVRQAAARTHVDAVLLLHPRSHSYANLTALSLLDLTLVGLFVVPSQEVHTQTALEGLVLDTRNEYLYSATSGYAEDETWSSSWKAADHARELETKTRRAALEAVVRQLVLKTAFADEPRPSS
jgi:rhombotail lipoprotein